MRTPPTGVTELGDRLESLGWVDALLVGGSAATGDHVPGVSDLDLVAVVAGRVDRARRAVLTAVHRDLDRGAAAGAKLGCAYVDRARLPDPAAEHPTWTHGRLVQRALSAISRAELVRHGHAVFGPEPAALLPGVSDDDVRRAARAELTGYWARAVRRPWWFLDPVVAELGLTSTARGRHALATGHLLTKTAAIDEVDAPAWLVARLRERRVGGAVDLPRWRTGRTAWADARRTVAAARRWTPAEGDQAGSSSPSSR